MINQREWLQTRKNLLEQVKSQVQVRLGPLPEPLRQYAKSLERDFKGPWKPSNTTELDRTLARAKVILSADFHAYAQSQRAHIRLLRDHLAGRQVILALECLNYKHDKIAQKYLRGQIAESTF